MQLSHCSQQLIVPRQMNPINPAFLDFKDEISFLQRIGTDGVAYAQTALVNIGTVSYRRKMIRWQQIGLNEPP